MFEAQNGFFSFDKGFVEKEDHGVYRPIMNEEIHRFYVRQTLEHLQQQHGDRYLEVLQDMQAGQYRNSLQERLGALLDKLPD
jgi:hypothetical protein